MGGILLIIVSTILKNVQHCELSLNDRAEINTISTKENIAYNLQRVIQRAIATDTLSMDWYTLPVDKFEMTVKLDFSNYAFPQNVEFDVKKPGLSGHKIVIPIMLSGGGRENKQIFTTSVCANGSWSSAYGVLGKIMDLTNPTLQVDSKS